MEILELTPPEFGVAAAAVYIVDDDGRDVCAGPFDTETAALAWLEERQGSPHRVQRITRS